MSPSAPMPPGIVWSCHRFGDLPPALLYRVLALRSAVFVVEQRCAYQDPDGADEAAWFVVGQTGPDPDPDPDPVPDLGAAAPASVRPVPVRPVLAHARILAPGVRYREASIGRVCTAAEVRGRGLGRALMTEAIVATGRLFPAVAIRISAQAHLAGFYGSLGFVVVSDPYDEDGIPHLEMLRD